MGGSTVLELSGNHFNNLAVRFAYTMLDPEPPRLHINKDT